MKYGLIERLMWSCYKPTFRKHLFKTLHESDPKKVMKSAHRKYKAILKEVDEFEKGDRFLINIVNCALLSSILLSLENKYSVEEIRSYYRNAMCTNLMTKMATKKTISYTVKGREKLKKQAERSQSIKNPYSWRFTVEDGKTINQYTATFYTCGICQLMKELGLTEYIPAMCTLDYDMARMNHTKFTRACTLAKGDSYCDCHYDHQPKSGK